MKKRIISALLIAVMFFSLCSCSVIGGKKVKFTSFTGNFSPFFAERAGDLSVVDMTQEALITNTNDEVQIRQNAYSEGVGIIDLEIDYIEEKCEYTIKLGHDIYFSDGEQMTVDDIIFSMYVYADPTYTGWCNFGDSNIVGLKSYQYNNIYADSIEPTNEQIDDIIARMPDELKESINTNIIANFLRSEYEWVCDVYNDGAYVGTQMEQFTKEYPVAKDLFAYLYAIDENYNSADVSDPEQVLSDIITQYGYDYKTLGKVLDLNLESTVRRYAREIVLEEELRNYESPEVKYIEGIKKIDDFTMSVTMKTFDDEDVTHTLSIYVAPLHYYGNEDEFDVNIYKFGFTRGDLSDIHEKDSKPMGAGYYTFESYKDGKSVTFERNKNHFREDYEVEQKVTFVATGNSNEYKDYKYYIEDEYVIYTDPGTNEE